MCIEYIYIIYNIYYIILYYIILYFIIYIYIWSVFFSVLLIPILAFEQAMRAPPTACFDSSARKPYRSAVDTYQSMGLQKGVALQENVDKNRISQL